ncbi:M15 family metallopeptidase [Nocardioides solisilvae]|uniref:M15 family metallopeptidase n=1 Tax=Nocardioides solisilvae TaxID=1542435 RepID=UPI000D74C302|nr:M15 family metallopeptidase [Nocardioides solisilvae]
MGHHPSGPTRRRTGLPARAGLLVGVLLASVAVGGCGGAVERAAPASPAASPGKPPGTPVPGAGEGEAATPPGTPTWGTTGAVGGPPPSSAPPPPLAGRLLAPDLLVHARRTLTDDEVARVRAVPGVDRVLALSLAQVAVQDRALQVAAVDPAQYRRFTPRRTARHRAVWARVAAGDAAVEPALVRRLRLGDALRLGTDEAAPEVRIGAHAPQVPQVDAVVNAGWGERLGMPAGNALLVHTGSASPQVVRPRLERLLGRALREEVSVQVLGPDLDVTAVRTAYLTGGSVAAAVGSFSYRLLGGGRVAPDPAWVAAHVRTEEVPLLGRVTCHRVVLPQLRAALEEVVASGLADKIHPDEYAGCYHPRFIAGTSTLSLHSFGIALDLNVPGNLRGTVGEIDRRVVAVMERWGFAWGGRWAWTDPMHFELERLVEPR